METTDEEQSPKCTENIRFLDLIRKPKFGQFFLKAFFFEPQDCILGSHVRRRSRNKKGENETRSAHTQGTQFTAGRKPGAHGPGITTPRIRKARIGCELLTELQGSVKSEPCEEIEGSCLSTIRLKERPNSHKFFSYKWNRMESQWCTFTRCDTWQLRYPNSLVRNARTNFGRQSLSHHYVSVHAGRKRCKSCQRIMKRIVCKTTCASKGREVTLRHKRAHNNSDVLSMPRGNQKILQNVELWPNSIRVATGQTRINKDKPYMQRVEEFFSRGIISLPKS